MTKRKDKRLGFLGQAVTPRTNYVVQRATNDPLRTNFFEDISTVILGRGGVPEPLAHVNDAALPSPDNLERYILAGRADLTGKKVIDVVNDNRKIIVKFYGSFYHQINDAMSTFLEYYRVYPDAEFIIDMSHVESSLHNNSEFVYIFEELQRQGIKYQVYKFSDYDAVYINKFTLAQQYDVPNTTDLVYDFFTKNIDTTQKPFRKVFLSRKEQGRRDQMVALQDGLDIGHDARIDDYVGLENLFKSIGFEVVTAADFKNFRDQIQYFQETELLVSTTGSGLTNAMFMQPGNNVVEIMTPLIIRNFFGLSEQQLHYFYQTLSFRKNHKHLNIPNYSRKTSDLVDAILSDPYLGALMNPRGKLGRANKRWFSKG